MSLKRKAIDVVTADAKKPKANGSITSFFGQPKRAAATDEDASKNGVVTKFDKEKWLGSLSDEQKELLKLEIDTLHESWLAHLKDEIVSKDFLELKRFLKKELDTGKTVYPPMEDVYSWSDTTSLIFSSTFTLSFSISIPATPEPQYRPLHTPT